MNSKRRCSACKEYFDATEAIKIGLLSGVCSSECLGALKDKARKKRARRAEHRQNKIRFGHRLAGDIRAAVRKRDHFRCRFCGVNAGRLEVHHIQYRSEGGRDEVSNLILLCAEHHRLMHTSKRRWQPVLQLMLWAYYTEGWHGTVVQADRILTPLLTKVDIPGDWEEAPA